MTIEEMEALAARIHAMNLTSQYDLAVAEARSINYRGHDCVLEAVYHARINELGRQMHVLGKKIEGRIQPQFFDREDKK